VPAPRVRNPKDMPMTTNHNTDAQAADREAEFLDLLAQVWPDDREAVLELLGAVAQASHT
jgi:hypothetical protein